MIVTVEYTKQEWIDMFDGDQSPLGQAFVSCLNKYNAQPEDVRDAVEIPTSLSGQRGRGRAGSRKERGRGRGRASQSEKKEAVAVFRSLLEEPEDTVWMQDNLAMLTQKHHSLVDLGPTQLDPIATGQLLPQNVVPLSSRAMRLLMIALHCDASGNTTLTAVTKGVRSFSCAGATPPFIRVIEDMLVHVERVIVILAVCGGWVRYRTELAELAQHKQIIFVLTGQLTVNLRDPLDSVLHSHFRLTAALLPVLDAHGRSPSFNSDAAAAVDRVMPKLLALVLDHARTIYGDLARTTGAEVLTYEGQYVSLVSLTPAATLPSAAASPPAMHSSDGAPSIDHSQSCTDMDVTPALEVHASGSSVQPSSTAASRSPMST